MEGRGPEVGLAPVLPDLELEALVLPAPHVGQPLPFLAGGRARVQVDRQVEPLGDPGPECPGDLDAFVDRGGAERDERDHVDRADPWVLALVGIHVDVVDGRRDEPFEPLGHGVMLAREREHRTVVAGVAGPVEQVHARDRGDGIGHPVDDVEAASLGHVGD